VSNLLLPSLRQPRALSWGWPVKKTPSYSTLRQTPASRRGEVRISLTPVPVWDFEIDLTYIYGDLNQTNSAIQQFLDFYQHMQGAANDWLFSDPYDNLATLQLIGYGDGTTTQFQIGRSLGSSSFEPIQNVIPSLVQINGVTVPAGPQTSGNQWYSGLENFLLYSQDFTQSSAWIASAVTVTGNAGTAPDGTLTTNKLARVGSGGSYNLAQIQNPLAFSPGDTITFSAYLLAGTAGVRGRLQVNCNTANGSNITASQSPSTTLSGAYVRVSVTTTVPVGTTQLVLYIILDNTVNPGDFLYADFAQIERWTSPTSYVATAAVAPVTPRGLLTFAIAPASGTSITVTFTYYYRCHFMDDELNDLEEFLWQLWECKALKFRSLIL